MPGFSPLQDHGAGAIAFDVVFGSSPRREIAFLRSYRSVGAFAAALAIGPCTFTATVNCTHNTERTLVSVTQVAHLGALPSPADVDLGPFPAPACLPATGDAAGDAAVHACADPCAPAPGISYRLTITPIWDSPTGGKVKIMGVTSC